MKILNEKHQSSSTTFNLVATASEINSAKDKILKQYQKDLKLSGFRAGKAPINLVEKNIDQNLLSNGTLEEVINDLYSKSILELKIKPVGNPDIKILKFVPFTELEISVNVDKIGSVTLPKYSDIKIKKPDTKVTTEQVNQTIEALRQRSADFSETTKEAKLNDRATIDFAGFDPKSNDPIAGTDGTDYPLILGSNSFIPGFEDELVGLKNKQTKEFTITFPKDYGVDEFKNRKVLFKVTVKKIESSKLPKLDDSFASKVGPFKTLEDLKKQLKTELEYENKINQKRIVQDEILNELAVKTKVSIPDKLIEDETEVLINQTKKDALSKGLTFDEYLKSQNMDQKQFSDQAKEHAINRVTSGIAIGEIAEQENIEITKEELLQQIEILKEQYKDPSMTEELAKPENQREILMRMVSDKVLNFIESKIS